MRIGELATRTGTSTRALRYYEEQGLLTAERNTNGYRDYPEDSVRIVGQIRLLLDAGLTTEKIALTLPCMNGQAVDMCPSVQSVIADTVRGIEQQMRELTAKRAQLDALLSSGTS